MSPDICAVVLAAGHGTRLRPLTDTRPKALVRVGGEPLVDGAVRRCRAVTSAIAVNAHAHAQQLVDHFAGTDVLVRVEAPEALGTAGALANLRDWIDGRAVLVHNADAWHDADLRAFVAGWAGAKMRLLVVPRPPASDFGANRYAGVSLLPWRALTDLAVEPTGLYEVLWQDAEARGELEFVVHTGEWFDCGTPETLADANAAAERLRTP